jgi:uroporphyrinogen decarboxylase
MDARQRFLATLLYGSPDRLPRLEEGIRDEVRRTWESQGLPHQADLAAVFGYDLREELELDLDPRPRLRRWPASRKELKEFQRRLNAQDSRRLPAGWPERIAEWRSRSQPLILRVQRGFFLSMGVEDWRRFHTVITLTKDDPVMVAELLRLQGELSASLVERLLGAVSVDAALFSEPIGGNHGPLISPRMYAELVLPSYQPILAALKRHQVPLIIARTYANPRPLLPLLVEAGVNCLWAVEAPPQEMDYRQLRQEFGRELRLIGGIDTDALREGEAAIRKAVEQVAGLAGDGGFIPLLDGRVREDVSYADYLAYRKLLEELTSI